MKSVILIDGDEFLFKACIAVEREIQWDESNHVLYANENEAYDNFKRMVAQTKERLGAIHEIICFGGARPYFREDLYPEYKSGRPDRKPLCYATLREWIDDAWPCKSYPHIEADDCLGILGSKPIDLHPSWPGGKALHETRFIMCSQDKDMKTVPGWHYDGKGSEAVWIDPWEAHCNHYLQTLIGDRSDHYPGCPGMGEKRAQAWLDRADDPHDGTTAWMWSRVEAAFLKAGLTKADALLQGRLARILQWKDWDYIDKKPVLWYPEEYAD